MIYQKITEAINSELGGDYVIEYANNHNVDWTKILPNVQNELKYGIVRVDSGQTLQAGDMPVRVEQLRLIVAIPEERDIFNQAVNDLRVLLNSVSNDQNPNNDGMNNTTVQDDDTNTIAQIFMNEYHDATSQTVNGNKWWIAEVTFTINLFDSIVSSADTSISIGGTTLKGIIQATYINEKTVDGYVYNNAPLQKNSVNGVRKQLTITLIYLKNDDIFHHVNSSNVADGILDTEDDITKRYTIVYNNGLISRTMTMYLASVSETMITADTVKATISFAIAE